MHIRDNEIHAFIKIQDRIKYLVLFDYCWFNKICDRIQYLMSEENGITDSINHNFSKIRIDSYNTLPIEKILTFHNVTKLINSLIYF